MNPCLALTVRRLLRVLPLAALILHAGTVEAQPTEAAVKAAFLSKFAAYVGWPAGGLRGESVTLCLVGGDPFGRTIDQAVRGQLIDGQPLQVKRLARPDDSAGCDLAFAANSAVLEAMRDKPVLTVTDARSSVRRGMIHFVVVEGRVRFHIDEAAAVRSGLTINSRLLALALSVRQRD